eukprot:229501-Rhodomonas_salina.2
MARLPTTKLNGGTNGSSSVTEHQMMRVQETGSIRRHDAANETAELFDMNPMQPQSNNTRQWLKQLMGLMLHRCGRSVLVVDLASGNLTGATFGRMHHGHCNVQYTYLRLRSPPPRRPEHQRAPIRCELLVQSKRTALTCVVCSDARAAATRLQCAACRVQEWEDGERSAVFEAMGLQPALAAQERTVSPRPVLPHVDNSSSLSLASCSVPESIPQPT